MNTIWNLILYRGLKNSLLHSLLCVLIIGIINKSLLLYDNVPIILSNIIWMSNIYMINLDTSNNKSNIYFTLPTTKKEYIISIYLSELIHCIFTSIFILLLKYICTYIDVNSPLLNSSYFEVFIIGIILGIVYKLMMVPAILRFTVYTRNNAILLVLPIMITILTINGLGYLYIKALSYLDKSFLYCIGIFICTLLSFISYKISYLFLLKKEAI